MAKINNYILVCGGTGCRASRSEEIIAALRRALDRTGESERTRVIRTGCFGFCEQGPIVKMIPDNTFYVSVKPEDAEEIVREHVVKGRKVERLLYTAPRHGAARTRQQAHEVLQAAAAHRPAELRVHRPREHRRIHRPRRLRSPGQSARHAARPRVAGDHRLRPAGGAAEAVSPPA